MRKKRLTHLLTVLVCIIFTIPFMNCVPPADAPEDAQVTQETVPEIDRDKCDLYLNFAYSYYQNQNWQSTINNYKKMLDYGCKEVYAQDIFPYFGRAYQQLAQTDPVYYDSALYVYEEGLKYLPENMYIRKNIAYIYHIQGKIDLEIREYEKMIEIEPENLELYRTYNKLCFSQERYEDMLWGISKILEVKPDDQEAINDRLRVYELTGQDISTIKRELWERNPGDVRYGLDYAKSLTERLEYDQAIEVLKKVTAADLKSKETWNELAELYKTLGRYKEAVGTYEHIHKNIDSQDLSVIENIVKMYINLVDFETAYTWAKKALSLEKSALTYKMRADVLFGAAEYYSSSRSPISFEDKLVYKLAYDDYLQAKKLGDFSSQSRIDFLKQYLIPTREDWFMNRYDASGKERSDFHPRLDCYQWIDLEASK